MVLDLKGHQVEHFEHCGAGDKGLGMIQQWVGVQADL